MNDSEILIVILKIIKIFIFLFGFIFSTYYGIPRGVSSFLEWRKTKEFSKLSRSSAFLAGSAFLLLYVSVCFIFELVTGKF